MQNVVVIIIHRNFKGYIVNGEHFRTKKELAERVRRILHSYMPYQKLKRKDFKFIFDLLQKHERVSEKIGCGVKAIEVRANTKYSSGNQCFWIIRTDGSKTDFSYQECITTPTSPRRWFKEACRRTVADQIVDFKREVFKQKANKLGSVKSDLTGKWVDFADADIDHTPPRTFDKLVEDFIKNQNIEIKQVEIVGFEDGSVEKKFADPEMAGRWAEYHRKHACLRIVSHAENLSTVKRQTRNQPRQRKSKKAHAPKSRRS